MENLFNQLVFIVDDDRFWSLTLFKMLKGLGYNNVTRYDSGKAALENLHHHPELIFLDYQMEDMDGLDVLQKIKQSHPNTGVIFCTALEDLSIAVYALQNGLFEYLLKSNFSKKKLLKAMQQIQEKITH